MIFLIDHDASFYGASKYLFYLFTILKHEHNIPLFYIGICPHDNIPYDLYYHNDITLLLSFIQQYKPTIIYINSWNSVMETLMNYSYDGIQFLLHSHECINDYPHMRYKPDFVVSSLISLQYKQKYNILPVIQPPIIPLVYINNILEQAKIPVSNYNKTNKITIGMCGQISKRKNFNIFIQIASVFPQYDFLWIGGHGKSFLNSSLINNLKIIPYTHNPYQYFYQCIDYFLLTSDYDPCPYVVLENIILETPIILFEKSIYTDHSHPLINSYVNIYKEAFHLRSAIAAIIIHVLHKKNPVLHWSGKGIEYIKQYFSYPHHVLEKLLTDYS